MFENSLAWTFDFIGKVLIGISVLLVHHRISKEKMIDKIVLNEMRKEYYIAVAGIVFLTIGYVFHFVL